ncbi:PAS domain S-box protein [Sphingomonas sp. PsM26]|nr:PAS domain S-box protein [Sphingomonas sp. PsM26]
MANRIRNHPWEETPLGPLTSWPQSLRTLVSVMLEANQPMFIVWGAEQTLLYNDRYTSILAAKHPDALGQPFLKVWHEIEADLRPLVDDAYAGIPSHTDDIMLMMERNGYPEETHFAYSYTPIHHQGGGIDGFFCPCIETTEQVKMARTVRENEVRNRQIMDSAIDYAIVATDLAGDITSWNEGATRVIGWTEQEMLGGPIDRFFTPEDRAGNRPRVEMEMALKTGRGTDERWHLRKSGERFFASGEMTVLRDAADQPVGFVKVLRDRTAERQADEQLRELNATLEERVAAEVDARMRTEEALRQSQKVEAIGQLTGGVAHDFNNLLTVIKGSVDLLRRADVSEERRKRYTDAIADTADRAAKLTGQLLAFARRQTLKPETFDAGESVSAIQSMIGTLTGSRIRIVTDIPAGAHPINADRSQFDTAIVNMAVNARDAMGGEGTLTLGIGKATVIPPVRAHDAIPGDFITITVRDTGAGIAADQIDRIFEPFFTTKGVGEGTGLGLSQVFGFAKQSGGEIIVESKAGEGAAFTLYLPTATTAADMVAIEASPANDGRGSGACILVVEDNAEVGRFATDALAELGYKTLLANDGASALAELASDASRFEIVFSDVVMPGMSGIELGEEIRRLDPNLPVILTSGYSTVLAENGTHGFELLRKPYSIDELARTLRATLDEKRSNAGR